MSQPLSCKDICLWSWGNFPLFLRNSELVASNFCQIKSWVSGSIFTLPTSSEKQREKKHYFVITKTELKGVQISFSVPKKYMFVLFVYFDNIVPQKNKTFILVLFSICENVTNATRNFIKKTGLFRKNQYVKRSFHDFLIFYFHQMVMFLVKKYISLIFSIALEEMKTYMYIMYFTCFCS